jgi:hypothetical protein
MNRVLNDPHNADAPDSRMVMYAMQGVFHRVMDKANINNIYTYIRKHFSLELQAVFHFGVDKYKPALVKTRGYIDWSVEYGDAVRGCTHQLNLAVNRGTFGCPLNNTRR